MSKHPAPAVESSTPPRAGGQPWDPAAGPRRSPPIALLALAAGLLVLGLGLAAFGWGLHTRAARLIGTTLDEATPAYTFSLRDEHGQRVQLADLRGKVVALTFLYTNCPDVCPLIADKFAKAEQQLGASGAKTAFLAVSVDPVRDTPAAAQAFDAKHGLQFANFHYLLGSAAELSPVWQHYYVGAEAQEVPGAPAAQGSTPSPQLINHTAVIYLIDPAGRLRVALDADFAVPDLLHDLHALGA